MTFHPDTQPAPPHTLIHTRGAPVSHCVLCFSTIVEFSVQFTLELGPHHATLFEGEINIERGVFNSIVGVFLEFN